MNFSGEADAWFGKLNPSPSTPEELFRLVESRFKGPTMDASPLSKFFSTLSDGRKPKQSWVEHFLEIRYLASEAELTERQALKNVRKYSHSFDREMLAVLISSTNKQSWIFD